MAKSNKVKFNLKNVHICPINKETGEYGKVIKVPGAVNLSMEPQGDIEPFYADGIVYYQSAANNGYSGTLEMALITDEVRQAIFVEVPNEDGVAIENVNVQYNDFALGFQVDGDQRETLFWYYNCSATRPTQEAATNEASKTPQTETLNISCTCNENGDVRAKTTADTPADVLSKWFEKPYKGENLPTGAAAFDADKTDYGGYGTLDKLYENVKFSWSGTDCTVTGKLKKAKKSEFDKLPADGNYLAFALKEQFKGKEITVANGDKVSTVKDTDWVCSVTAEKKPITVKRGALTIATYDVSAVELLEE